MYTVLARKWRPQRFDDVVGQQAVTRTLRNAIAGKRIHQAYVFAGPRGVGKTTTARLLARALNCVQGPTADPCGVCEACVEIAAGRDMDVLEIDAATHTGVDNVREVIISGLAIPPVRDRYKVFIIDEVHQLSTASFNALLKSIEEPPPHAVFIMATTAGDKIPDTILSRAQVFEFRPIGLTAIAAQLRMISGAEGLTVPDEALALIARAADGSMRDAESALDQVIAFAGTTIALEDVSTVLGIVGRDLLFDVVAAVADENPVAAFTLTGRAVAQGYDLRLVCRELANLARDLLLVHVDPSCAADPDVAAESERERLRALAARFSREDLLRGFDLFSGAERDIKESAQPRYFLEMQLLRWMHLRKLLPIEDVIAGLDRGSVGPPSLPRPPGSPGGGGLRQGGSPTRPAFGRPDPLRKPGGPQATVARLQEVRAGGTAAPSTAAAPSGAAAPAQRVSEAISEPATADAEPLGPDFRDRFLTELKRTKAAFFGMVVAQAQAVECDGRRLVFTFGPDHDHLRKQIETRRQEIEAVAQQLAGRRVPVATERGAQPAPTDPPPRVTAAPPPPTSESDLRARALADANVQALLEIIPAEIRDVEEM
jgi:DNA polymerase-3 subunit gamma/tau